MQVFVYRQNVYTDPDLLENGLNITPMLRDLNQFAKEKQVSLLYHDFTGRQTALLAEYFDSENKDYLDQIIYGMSGREDHGCFFDLTQPTAYFPFKLDYHGNRRTVIKMFNYYNYCVNKTYDISKKELETYAPEMHSMALAQKEQVIRTIHTQFKVTNISALRQVRKYLLQAEQHIAAQHIAEQHQAQAEHNFNDMPKFYREMFADLFKEKDYSLLYELLFNYCASELDKLTNLKDMALTGEDLLTFITMDEDPYKWYNTMNEMIL